jgi:hypothetical protein
MSDYMTREDWLNAFIDKARATFESVNAPLPINVRVAVGFTSKGVRGTRIGEVWSDSASEDGHFEIFIKPTLEGAAPICATLTHELVHAAVGLAEGHGQAFKRVAMALGLQGKMTEVNASHDWYAWAIPIIEELGPMPYGALSTAGYSSARRKQKTALLKLECPVCGWLARVTAKHIDAHTHLNCPVPDCVGVLDNAD